MTTSDKQKDADDATNARKNLENDIKAADARIQNIKSDIDKNLD
jgi:peptidoglycan hydrolase CwlO-like protein